MNLSDMKLVSLKLDPNIKISNDIIYYLNPDFIYIPKKDILVNQDEFVYKNSLVTSSCKSSVSGIAIGIKKCLIKNQMEDTIVIKNDYRELEKKEKRAKRKTTIKNILECLEKNDLAMFEKFKNQTKFSNIVINALNDEPYIYNNIFILKENIDELLELFDELSFLYKADNNYLVIKNVDTMIINECLNAIGTYPNINLTLVSDEYLLERKEFLETKLPIKENTLYLSTVELLQLNNYLTDKDNTTILLTISGSALSSSNVIRVKKYTSLKDIIDNYFEITTNEYQAIANGLMQGFLISDISNFIITEDIFAINIMKADQEHKEECINCGKCIDICPVGVNPLSGKNFSKCINCGLCSYICPGFVNLKEKLKEYQNNEG